MRETSVSAGDLIFPIFVSETATAPEAIASMPGQFRLPLSHVGKIAKQVETLDIGGLLIFGVPAHKDDTGSGAYDSNGIVQNAVREAKSACPDLVIATDVCLCAYMDHGHCGVLKGSEIDNDRTLDILAQTAISHARAGADVVGPSSVMDFQVRAVRQGLDQSGFDQTAIMAYSAKFASAFYGPFRDASDSSPSFGDRASYQHDFGNLRHARREILADEAEGADLLMVKPGIAYLDVVHEARSISNLPIVAYNVSGEYSMLKAASERGWLDERKVVLETLIAFKRAGADLIITYHALEAAKWLKDN